MSEDLKLKTEDGAKPKRKLFLNTSLLSFYRGDVNLLCKDIKNWQNHEYNIAIITNTFRNGP